MRLVDAIIHQRSWDPTRQDLRERATKEITNIVLTAQAAKKEKFTADPDFAAQVELGRLQALSNATAAAFRERAPFDEAAAAPTTKSASSPAASPTTTSRRSSCARRPKRPR